MNIYVTYEKFARDYNNDTYYEKKYKAWFIKAIQEVKMEKFIEKLEEYKIFNYLLPGIIFTYLLKYYVGIDIFQSNAIEMAFIFYFIGSIISRFGSVVIEEILKKIKFIKYSNYNDYINAVKKDDFIKRLLISNNTYRTMCAGFLLILFLKGVKELIKFFNLQTGIIYTIIIICGFILYLVSFKKQTSFIVKRVDKVKSEENKTED